MNDPGHMQASTILMTLLAAAFAAWAGVIMWFGTAISDRLSRIEQSLEAVKIEVSGFKLDVSTRVTRAETRVEGLEQIKRDVERIDSVGPATPNRELNNTVYQLDKRIEKIEQRK